jgi:hypothetical protein
MEAAQVVAQAVHSIWEEWSKRSQAFQSERPEMQRIFQECLGKRLPEGWSARRESHLSLRSLEYSAWSQYDIGVLRDDRLIALLELSLGDTNVPHALHNGELKLLGNCGGIGRTSGRPYSVERGLSPDDVARVQGRLQSIPIRGLFFVNGGPTAVLDRPDKAMWWETKAKGFIGETRFWSALLGPEKETTLRRVFERLAEAGLCCWFYSLCGEGRCEYLPAPSSGAT